MLTAERRTALEQRGGEIYRTALTENRQLTDAEKTELRSIELQLDRAAYETANPSEAQQRFAAGAGEQREQPRVLTSEMRMREFVRGSYPAEFDGLDTGRFIRGWLTGRWDGAELEQRAMAIGTLGAGGALLPTPLSANIIDLIRNQAIVMRAGATTVPMSTSTLTYARVKTDPSAGWVAENGDISATDGELEQIEFKAKKLAGIVKMSVELVEDTNASSLIESAIAQVLSLELDRATLFGSGSGEEPLGIHTLVTGTSQIPEVVMGANGAALDSYDKLSEAYFTGVGNNVTPRVAVYAPRTAQTLDQLKTAVDLTPLPAPASWNSLTKYVSNQIPVNLTQGTANNASSAFVGDFSGVGVGMRTDLVLEASRTAGDAFVKGQVWLRAYLRADVKLLRTKHITVVRGIIP